MSQPLKSSRARRPSSRYTAGEPLPPLWNWTLMSRPIDGDGTCRYSTGRPGRENAPAVAAPPARLTRPGRVTAAAAPTKSRRPQARIFSLTSVIPVAPLWLGRRDSRQEFTVRIRQMSIGTRSHLSLVSVFVVNFATGIRVEQRSRQPAAQRRRLRLRPKRPGSGPAFGVAGKASGGDYNARKLQSTAKQNVRADFDKRS